MTDQTINPMLLKLAQSRVWQQAGQEKLAFQPGPAADPMAAGGAPPPGAPPMDPAMAGGMPPPGMPPMDPAATGAAGMPPMDPAMMGMPQGAPAGGGGAGGKPKFDPLMLDYRMYNLQQQLSAIMNALNIEVPPQALIMPPGTMGAPPAEQAMPGGPMDPSQMGGGGQGGGGGSAIGAIEPMQGASPEMAAIGGGGGGPKMAAQRELPEAVIEFQKEAAANAPDGWRVVMLKAGEGGIADTRSTDGNVEEEPGPKQSSPPQKGLNVAGAPGTRPTTQAITAGGSKDPQSRTEAGDGLGPANKAAAFGSLFAAGVGTPVPTDTVEAPPEQDSPVEGAAALAAMFRSRTQHGQ